MEYTHRLYIVNGKIVYSNRLGVMLFRKLFLYIMYSMFRHSPSNLHYNMYRRQNNRVNDYTTIFN